MHIVEEVSLVDFYRHHVARLPSEGVLGLILALVREADAPEVYRDLSRHWWDLHDLTGRRVVFAVAGAPLPADQKATADSSAYCANARIIGSGLRLRESQLDESTIKRALRSQSEYVANNPELLRYGRGTIDPATLGDNSIQVTELRQLLGISESQTPCLHFTLLHGNQPTFIISLEQERSQSLWGALKQLMATISEPVDQLDHDERMERFGRLPELQPLHESLQRRLSVESNQRTHLTSVSRAPERREKQLAALWAEFAQLRQQNNEDTLGEIGALDLLRICRDGFRDQADRTAAFAHFGMIKGSQALDSSWNAKFQQLIDLTSAGRTSLPSEVVALNKSIKETRNALAQLGREIKSERESMVQFLRDRASDEIAVRLNKYREVPHELVSERWDYFVSYPKPDRHNAIQVWRHLSKTNRCFLDTHCLRPAVDWEQRLETALARSHTAVIVVTPATRRAHYQVAEIQRAVNHYRAGHLSLAVFRRVDAELPLGLEPIQHVPWSTDNDLDEAVERFISH